MKIRLTKLLACLLAALMALTMTACAESTAEAAQYPGTAVAMTVNGEEITKDKVIQYAQMLQQNGYTETVDYNAAATYLAEETLLSQKIVEMGLDQYTEDEEAAFLLDAQVQFESDVEAYVEYYLTEDTEEGRAQAREDAIAYYQAYAYNTESILQNLLLAESFNRLQQKMLEGRDVAVTDEEVTAAFEQYAQDDKANFENNVAMYEMYQQYYGYQSWYQPEGFRGVTHILLEVDESLLTAYQDALALAEESDEGADAAALEAVEAARQAVLASRQEDMDTIYARLSQGESFETLVKEFGTDQGMESEEYLKNGYAVHKDSIVYDQAFTDGAFSEKMQKVGDVSDPVVSSHGIHILNYVQDIPGGFVELTEDIRNEIATYLASQKESAAYTEVMAAWMAEAQIQVDDAVIASITAEETAEETAE